MTYRFVIIDEDNWAPSWREQYRRVNRQVNDDFRHYQDIEIDQNYLTSNARNALVNLVKDKYKKDGEKRGYVQSDEFGIGAGYLFDANREEGWLDLTEKYLTAMKSEYISLLNYRFLYRNCFEHDNDVKHDTSLELLTFDEFRDRVYDKKSQINSKYISDKINQIDKYYRTLQLMGKASKDDDIICTILYDTIRQRLILGNIDVQCIMSKPGNVVDIDLIIPSFIDEIQHISTLIKYENVYDIDVKLKIQSVKPLTMTNLYQYQIFDTYSTELSNSLVENVPFQSYLGPEVDTEYRINRPGKQDGYMNVNIDLDLTDLQLKAISISDIENQIINQDKLFNRQLAKNRILGQLKKQNTGVSRTAKVLQIKATDLFDLVEMHGTEYKSREDWIKKYYDELWNYIDVDKNPELGLPCILPCNFTVNTIRVSNKTVQDTTNLKGLFSYIGAKSVILSNDLDNFNETDESDDVCDLFGDKNVDGMLEDSRINEIKTENMSDYETEMLNREHKRSRAELRDKIETYRKK